MQHEADYYGAYVSENLKDISNKDITVMRASQYNQLASSHPLHQSHDR